jgi:hypothetical protein
VADNDLRCGRISDVFAELGEHHPEPLLVQLASGRERRVEGVAGHEARGGLLDEPPARRARTKPSRFRKSQERASR